MVAGLIAGLVPAGVRTAEVFGDVADVSLFPEEEIAIASAVDARRREFAMGRHCARAALSALGRPAVPLSPDEHGVPSWPDGVVGSLTHCHGYRAAAVAGREDVMSLGIDAEPHRPLPQGVLEAVTIAPERAALAVLADSYPSVHWDRLLFSAKESVFKSWFSMTGDRLGFDDAEVEFEAEIPFFRARVLRQRPGWAGKAPMAVGGRWLVCRGLVLAAVSL
ncbi:4'-phosphopantetheinyl transferase family protein [Streptomyces poriticola]|uniref:4'-phosphopantetheinyl transferase family protein n=1 Tax=Streptomyces poriticola TaxID=3120506 RepID=UPI002FCDF37E